MFNAIVLAGSRNNGPLKTCDLAKDEALIKIGDRFMVEYVVDSLCGSSNINKIFIVGPEQELTRIYRNNHRVVVTASGVDAIDSLRKGIANIGNDSQRVLVVTSDIPMITTEALDSFLAQGRDENIDVYYPVVPRDIIQQKFPHVERTYVNLREGVFTGGNIFLINPQIVDTCAEKAQHLVDLRKSPIKLCRLLGMFFVIKFLLRRLSMEEIEQKVSSIMKIKGAGIISSYPEVGVDIDKPSDLYIVRKSLLKAN